jgi:hypothetical protein
LNPATARSAAGRGKNKPEGVMICSFFARSARFSSSSGRILIYLETSYHLLRSPITFRPPRSIPSSSTTQANFPIMWNLRLEKLHLDCASSAPSQHGSTQQWPLLHRKDYLQGSEIPAISPSRLVPIIATSPEPMATAPLGQMVTLSPCRLAEQPLRVPYDIIV